MLAEDPGCSALTVTGLGMAARSRAIAPWRDITGPDTIIERPEKANAADLPIVCKRLEEYAAEGRGDGGVAFFPMLSGWRTPWVPDAPAVPAPPADPGNGGRAIVSRERARAFPVAR